MKKTTRRKPSNSTRRGSFIKDPEHKVLIIETFKSFKKSERKIILKFLAKLTTVSTNYVKLRKSLFNDFKIIKNGLVK